MIQKGDVVKIHKPKDINEYPFWDPVFMDKYDGLECVVERIVNLGDDSEDCHAFLTKDAEGYLFRDSWAEVICDDDIEEPDDDELKSFIQDFTR